jgi:hypothetical protein
LQTQTVTKIATAIKVKGIQTPRMILAVVLREPLLGESMRTLSSAVRELVEETPVFLAQ